MIYAGVQKNVGPASMVIVMGICLGTTLPGNDQNSGKGRNMAALPSLLVSGRTLPSHRGNKGRQREIAKNGQKDSFVFYTVQMPKQYLFMKSAVA